MFFFYAREKGDQFVSHRRKWTPWEGSVTKFAGFTSAATKFFPSKKRAGMEVEENSSESPYVPLFIAVLWRILYFNVSNLYFGEV